jgi:hypothetical protein
MSSDPRFSLPSSDVELLIAFARTRFPSAFDGSTLKLFERGADAWVAQIADRSRLLDELIGQAPNALAAEILSGMLSKMALGEIFDLEVSRPGVITRFVYVRPSVLTNADFWRQLPRSAIRQALTGWLMATEEQRPEMNRLLVAMFEADSFDAINIFLEFYQSRFALAIIELINGLDSASAVEVTSSIESKLRKLAATLATHQRAVEESLVSIPRPSLLLLATLAWALDEVQLQRLPMNVWNDFALQLPVPASRREFFVLPLVNALKLALQVGDHDTVNLTGLAIKRFLDDHPSGSIERSVRKLSNESLPKSVDRRLEGDPGRRLSLGIVRHYQARRWDTGLLSHEFLEDQRSVSMDVLDSIADEWRALFHSGSTKKPSSDNAKGRSDKGSG